VRGRLGDHARLDLTKRGLATSGDQLGRRLPCAVAHQVVGIEQRPAEARRQFGADGRLADAAQPDQHQLSGMPR
jgi:hypothetical protein